MRYEILVLAVLMFGCEVPESDANSTDVKEESYADRFLRNVEINLVADGASEQEAAKVREGAKSKIDSLSLVNVDTNDSDRVSSLGLQGALQSIDSIPEKENQDKLSKIILAAVSRARLKDSKKETAVDSLNEMLRFFTEYNPDSEIVGIAVFKLKSLLSDYGTEVPEKELIHTVLTGLKNASVDLSSDPDTYFVEKFEIFSESYVGENLDALNAVEAGVLTRITEPFMKALPEVFDFTQETMDYAKLISKLGAASKKVSSRGPDGMAEEMNVFEKELLASGKEALGRIYGDSTEAAEIEDQFQRQFEETLDAIPSVATDATTPETCNEPECQVSP